MPEWSLRNLSGAHSDLNRRPEFGLAEPISLGYRSTFYDHWRPVTAVRAADTDDNPVTEPDPEWSSLIPTPAFPAYTSGHSTFSATAATILALVLGRDEIPFGAASDGLPGMTRSVSSFAGGGRGWPESHLRWNPLGVRRPGCAAGRQDARRAHGPGFLAPALSDVESRRNVG
jgi:hypothetical protein